MQCENTIPKVLTAGLDWRFSISPERLPSWVKRSEISAVTLLARGSQLVTIYGIADPQSSGKWDFTLFAEETAELTPGRYWYQLRGEQGTALFDLGRGSFTVAADLATDSNYDGRTENEKALEAIEAVIAGRAKVDQQRYRINNRELYRESITELLRLRKYYASLVAQERRLECGGNPYGRRIKLRLQ